MYLATGNYFTSLFPVNKQRYAYNGTVCCILRPG